MTIDPLRSPAADSISIYYYYYLRTAIPSACVCPNRSAAVQPTYRFVVMQRKTGPWLGRHRRNRRNAASNICSVRLSGWGAISHQKKVSLRCDGHGHRTRPFLLRRHSCEQRDREYIIFSRRLWPWCTWPNAGHSQSGNCPIYQWHSPSICNTFVSGYRNGFAKW